MKKILDIIRKYYRFLKNNVYYFNDTYSQLSVAKTENVTDIKAFEKGKTGIKRKVKKIIYDIIVGKKVIVDDEKSKLFDGNMLLIPTNNYGVKVFNQKEVLTVFENINDLEKNLSNRNKMGLIFNTPNVIKVDKENMYIIEERKYNKDNLDKEKVILDIMNSYIKYLSHDKTKLSIKKMKENRNEKLYKNFYERIKVSKDTYESILQHGDLWIGNIIKEEDRNYIIDYEEVEDNYFLYDFFKFIYSEAYIFNDYSMLNNYFRGKYDEVLDRYFKSLNIVYDNMNKKEYFMIFLNLFIHYRTKSCSSYIFKLEIDLVKKVLNNIEF